MIDLKTLPEPQFVTVNWEQQYKELVDSYEQIVGIPLTKGQVESLMLSTFNYRENILRLAINDSAKQNLLAFAKGPVLDHLGAFLGVSRLQAVAAITTLRFTFSEPLTTSLLVPGGTRVNSKDRKATFATSADAIAEEGSTYIDIAAACTEAGEVGNGYLAGDVQTLVDPLPYVQSVENTTVTYGGAEIENDDRLRLRIQVAPESFSTAGPEGGYEYWAKTAHQDITDVKVWSPSPGTVKVAVLMKGGELPDADMLALVSETIHAKKRRPLTDNVIVEAPQVINYSIDVQLYTYNSASMLSDAILTQANTSLNKYADSLKEKLGLDIVPEQIVGTLQKITGVYRPIVSQPAYAELGVNQVAICTGITVAIVESVNG